ncbi:uncharacterized protein MONBRDRAFT_30710 [Monosiga brevicollis MX1]|uniref:3'-5' exonuclease domain-containing protein n=1 Tax=Monosiga brevicollis TaxID=81824 RepID=A9UNQ2_MONBE|nr:uncharacterized protein MONBRDRAFT_30710 [Monosiga brevicollis MX1]EDQ92739.1 predicted protein [Monosiga brevicollis MX1]|eukprot:XP_001742501.1 hypothetical protein [Monosiga brevicollis MX1]
MRTSVCACVRVCVCVCVCASVNGSPHLARGACECNGVWSIKCNRGAQAGLELFWLRESSTATDEEQGGRARRSTMTETASSLTAVEVGEQLRRACKRTFFKCRDVSEAQAVVSAAQEAGIAPPDYINLGNENGKTALMYAAQLSSSEDLVHYLLQLGADPNQSTKRGHTAVMFAAGKGRWRSLLHLLDEGGSLRLTVVTGDTPLGLARLKLSESEMTELEHREAAETREWRDFTKDDQALAAQSTHVATCRHCRAKLGLEPHTSGSQRTDEAVQDLEPLPVDQVVAALGPTWTTKEVGFDQNSDPSASQLALVLARTIHTCFTGPPVARRQFFEQLPQQLLLISPLDESRLADVAVACQRRELRRQLNNHGILFKRAVNMIKFLQRCFKEFLRNFCTRVTDSSVRLQLLAPATIALTDSTVLVLLLEHVQDTLHTVSLTPVLAEVPWAVILDHGLLSARHMARRNKSGEAVHTLQVMAAIVDHPASGQQGALNAGTLLDTAEQCMRDMVAQGNYPMAAALVDKWSTWFLHSPPVQSQRETGHLQHVFASQVLAPGLITNAQLSLTPDSSLSLTKLCQQLASLATSTEAVSDELAEKTEQITNTASLGTLSLTQAKDRSALLHSLTRANPVSLLKIFEQWGYEFSTDEALAVETLICARTIQTRGALEAAEYAATTPHLLSFLEVLGVPPLADLLRAGVAGIDNRLCLPKSTTIHFVGTQSAMQDARQRMEQLLTSPRLVGIDTEWRSPRPTCSLIQVAMGDDVFLLDAVPGMGDAAYAYEVVDVQPLAQSWLQRKKRPGLGTVVAAVLGQTLDKRNQCSNWDRRPLRPDQAEYAAIDAWCLAPLYEQLVSSPSVASRNVGIVADHGEDQDEEDEEEDGRH